MGGILLVYPEKAVKMLHMGEIAGSKKILRDLEEIEELVLTHNAL